MRKLIVFVWFLVIIGRNGVETVPMDNHGACLAAGYAIERAANARTYCLDSSTGLLEDVG